MNEDGCGHMFWDTGGTGGHKNKTRMGHLGTSRSSMSGEMTKMGVEGCGWMHMGAMGGMRTGKNKNKAKERPNDRPGDVFECVSMAKKYIMFASMVVVRREDQGEK